MIVVHSGAARRVLRSAPDTAEVLLLSIERTGRDSLAELRRLVGLCAPTTSWRRNPDWPALTS
jgi:hypothetical protein